MDKNFPARWRWITGVVIAALGVTGPAAAQDGGQQSGPDSCPALYEAATVDLMANCFDRPVETVCAASGEVTISMVSGQVVDGAGSAARVTGVASLSAGGSAWSIATISLPDVLDPAKAATLIALGPLDITFDQESGLPPGAAFTVSAAEAPLCGDLPQPGILIQSPEKSLTLLRVNGVDLAINGMAVIHPQPGGGLTVNALSRETILGQSGTVVFAGYAVTVTDGAVSDVTPYDPAAVANLPVEILPRMVRITLPGNAMVREQMTLFSRPAAEAYTNTLVPAGLPANVFGRSADDQWVYIRTYDGVTGWFPLYNLEMRVAGAVPVLDAAPPDLIRPFGSVQGYVVTSAEHNNLRDGPGAQYEIVVTVPLWTELALYGRSPDDQWLYVETADGLRAWANVVLISPSTPYTLSELPYPPGYGG